MWWNEVASLAREAAAHNPATIDPTAIIEPGAVLDDADGPITIGARSRICAGAILTGPARIGSDCLVGTHALIRGPVVIGDDVRIGYSTEIKQARIAAGVRIGPMCFVADSIVEDLAYLGAMVRTSNHRLDGAHITVRGARGEVIETDREKLGCLIGAGTSLGIQVIVLPGRVVPPHSIFEPRITVTRNHRPGHYRVRQTLDQLQAS